MTTEARILSDGSGHVFVEWSRRPSTVSLDEVLDFARTANGNGIHLVIDTSHGAMTEAALDLHGQLEAEGIVHDVRE